jgi:hypothetical protein
MRVFLFACVAAVAIGMTAAFVLQLFQKPVSTALATTAARPSQTH